MFSPCREPAGSAKRGGAEWRWGEAPQSITKIIDPVLPNGTFLQNPGLEPSDLAISCLQTVPQTKMKQLANLGASSLIRRFLIRDTSL